MGERIGASIRHGQISPQGWDHINLSGDYVFSDNPLLDSDGFLQLRVVTLGAPNAKLRMPAVLVD